MRISLNLILFFLSIQLYGQNTPCDYCERIRKEAPERYQKECIQKDTLTADPFTYTIKKLACGQRAIYEHYRTTDQKLYLSYQLTDSNDTLFVFSENKNAEYNGGEKAMFNYLIKTVAYPREALRKRIEGRVIVSFIITETGKATDFKIIRSVHPVLDAEAMRVFSMMTDWNYGEYNGIPKKFIKIVPLLFKLPTE